MVPFTNINDIYIKLVVFILKYLQNKSISAIENNNKLTLNYQTPILFLHLIKELLIFLPLIKRFSKH